MKIEELIENLEYVEKTFGNIEVNIDCPYGGIPNFKIPNFGVGEIDEAIYHVKDDDITKIGVTTVNYKRPNISAIWIIGNLKKLDHFD